MAAKTSLKKSICILSVFIAIISTHLLCKRRRTLLSSSYYHHRHHHQHHHPHDRHHPPHRRSGQHHHHHRQSLSRHVRLTILGATSRSSVISTELIFLFLHHSPGFLPSVPCLHPPTSRQSQLWSHANIVLLTLPSGSTRNHKMLPFK